MTRSIHPTRMGLVFGAALLASLALPFQARAEATRVTNPNAISVEVFGRGIRYTVDYDRVLSDDLVAGVGIGSTELNFPGGVDASVSATLVPVYANYYFTRDQGSFYATAGATLVTNPQTAKGLNSSLGNLTFNSSGVIPVFGVGYENRSDAGFIFRATAYAMGSQNWTGWFGINLGYSF